MQRPEKNVRLIRDVIPRQQHGSVENHTDNSAKAPAPVQVIHYKNLHLKPEQESRLHFYSELARPVTSIHRVRRAKASSPAGDGLAEDQTTLSFLQAASTAREKPTAEQQPEEDALYKMVMADINEESTKAANDDTALTMQRLISTLFSRMTLTSKKISEAVSAVSVRPTISRAVKRLKTQRHSILIAGITILVSLALYQFAYKPIMDHRQQSAAQSTQWKKDQAQWQCTLRNYEAQQSGNNKEQSCVNN